MAPPRRRKLAAPTTEIDAGRTLAFVNTLSARPTSAPAERLVSYEAFVAWAREAGILKTDEAERLAARARKRPAEAHQILERARQLRELLHDALGALGNGRTPSAALLDQLSTQLSGWYAHGRLVGAEDHLEWAYGSDDDLDRPLWETARAAARLLTSPLVGRARPCASTDCAWWFLDDTKNASRRWCDMKICGNRDKVRRFRERQRE
jgi:predicted RNA-binding Zn ribbon-like protein